MDGLGTRPRSRFHKGHVDLMMSAPEGTQLSVSRNEPRASGASAHFAV